MCEASRANNENYVSRTRRAHRGLELTVRMGCLSLEILMDGLGTNSYGITRATCAHCVRFVVRRRVEPFLVLLFNVYRVNRFREKRINAFSARRHGSRIYVYGLRLRRQRKVRHDSLHPLNARRPSSELWTGKKNLLFDYERRTGRSVLMYNVCNNLIDERTNMLERKLERC